jgi:hypothetical protein
MSGLIRQGHLLGAKLRSLRKRNGLTLDAPRLCLT